MTLHCPSASLSLRPRVIRDQTSVSENLTKTHITETLIRQQNSFEYNLIKLWYGVSNTSRKNLDGKPNSLKERSHIKSQENFNVDNTLPFCCRRVHKLDGP